MEKPTAQSLAKAGTSSCVSLSVYGSFSHTHTSINIDDEVREEKKEDEHSLLANRLVAPFLLQSADPYSKVPYL